MITDIKEFIEWHDNYLKQLGGYRPKDIQKWLDGVDKNHLELRNLFNGVEKTYSFNFEKQTDDFIPDSDNALSYINSIIYYLPSYLEKYNLIKEDLLYPHIKKLKGISTTKHISGFLERNNIPLVTKVQVAKLLEELGKIFKERESLVGEISFDLTLSTDPKLFAQLGHFANIDNDSCFQQNSINTDKKFAIADTPNSFIYLVKQNKKLLGRGIGFIQKLDMEAIHTCNYCSGKHGKRPIFDHGRIRQAFLKISQDLLKTEIAHKDGLFTMKGGCNYINSPVVSYFDKNRKIDIFQYAQIPTQYSKEKHPNSDYYADR